jgi:phage host-nuclease inhibitor protein Gam
MKINSIKGAEQALDQLLTCEANLSLTAAKANKGIAAIRESYLDDMAEYEKESVKLRNALQAFADASRENEEIFIPGKKSLDLNAGIIGYTDAPAQIVLRDGWDTEEVIKKAEELGVDIVKEGKPSLDKTAAKKLWQKGELDDKGLAKLGLRVDADNESFYIKLKSVDTK